MVSGEKRVRKTRLRKIRTKIEKFIEDLYSGEITYKHLYGKTINAVKIFIVSSRKFIDDDCFSKAASLAYATIISLIPTLTVALTFYSIFAGVGNKKEELFQSITTFMIEHNIKLDLAPILNSISSLIENAGKIGGVGAVLMVFTATAVLRTMERSFNYIWQVKRQRPFFLKIVYYWAALTLAPLMLIAGTTVATHISTVFSPPNFQSIAVAPDKKLWATGQKATLSYTKSRLDKMTQIRPESIDYENQRIYDLKRDTVSFVKREYKLDQRELMKTEITDIHFTGRTIWAAGKNGIVLISRDSGASWSLSKWGNFSFNDIHMLNDKKGFIAADNGYLLKTRDSGQTWETVELGDYSFSLNSISFRNGNGIVAGNRGVIFTTTDGGETWLMSVLNGARRGNGFHNLNAVFHINPWQVWIAGDGGLLLNSSNGGTNWRKIRFLERDYYSIYFVNSHTGYAGGEKGTLIFTANAGNTWTTFKMPTARINSISQYNGGLVIAGNGGMLLQSRDAGKTWSGTKGRNPAGFLLNFFAPFVIIWCLFLFTYIWIPNMKVSLKASAIGASFTGAVWVTFILGFIVYVKSFARGTFAIYGGLAAIPIFLLMIYASFMIILYGAEISYTIMHPHTYMKLKKTLKERKGISAFIGIALLYIIYRNFEEGRGPTYFKDLLKVAANRTDEVDFFTGLLVKENLILTTEEGGYVPTKASKSIYLYDVIELVHNISLSIPPHGGPESLRRYIHNIFAQIKSSRKEVLKEITLQHVINGS